MDLDAITTLPWARYAPAYLGFQLLVAALWLGTILCVRSLASRARWMADPEETGRLARGLFGRFAWAWLLLSLAGAAAYVAALHGAWRTDRSLWGSVLLAVFMIALHAVVGRRAARVARGEVHDVPDHVDVGEESYGIQAAR